MKGNLCGFHSKHGLLDLSISCAILLQLDGPRHDLPGGQAALDVAGLGAAHIDRLDVGARVDADRAVARLDSAVVTGVLDHQVARRADRQLSVAVGVVRYSWVNSSTTV